MAAHDERALVEAAQRGDRAALERLLGHHAQALFAGVVLPRVGHRADAEDLVREAVARAVERLPTFVYREETGFYPWLRTIAERLVIDRARRLEAAARGADRYEAEVRTLAPAAARSVESEAIEREERAGARAALERALAELNPRYRRVIELRVIEEKSRDECAALLGVTVANLDVLVHRALTALRSRMTLSSA
jgi:RNA polymerase sigma-70 factor (ECF subfamily)